MYEYLLHLIVCVYIYMYIYLAQSDGNSNLVKLSFLHKNAACNPEQVLAATPHKTPTVRPPAPYHENYSS